MKPNIFFIIFLLFISGTIGFSQNPNALINLVNIDSLTKTVRELSGEDSVVVYGQIIRIKERKSNEGSNKAVDYIKQKLERFGLETTVQNYRSTGRNIYAIQKGEISDSAYIFCAHYDSVTDYCADDNASGTASVLEAARLLADSCFRYSIIYALWDEEELGLVGSHAFAAALFANGLKIKGVLNFDMVAFDYDNDRNFEIHENNDKNTRSISEALLRITKDSGLNLVGVIKNPGTGASDHASFWDYNIGGVLVIEEYYSGDFNSYYHSPNDRIVKFNLPYFHDMVKLGVLTIADLARSCNSSSIENGIDSDKIIVYPNPVSDKLNISLNDCTPNQIVIFDVFGKPIFKKSFQNEIEIDMQDFVEGIYLIKLQYDNQSIIRKIIKVNY